MKTSTPRSDSQKGWFRAALLAAAILTLSPMAASSPLAQEPDSSEAPVPVTASMLGAVLVAPLLLRPGSREASREDNLDDLIQTVSHDLRAPLTAAEGYLRFLMEGDPGPLNEEQRELLSTALGSIDRLERFISDTLDQARMDSGAMQYRFETAAVAPVVQDAFALFRFAAQEKGVSLRCRLDSSLPAARMDRVRIRQVLANLISNALKFTEPGGRVTVSAELRGGRIEVAVADTGAGIPPEEMGKLFRRFHQAHLGRRERAAARGTGLGLWISQGIVRAHGSEIRADSEVGSGSIFRFNLRPDQG